MHAQSAVFVDVASLEPEPDTVPEETGDVVGGANAVVGLGIVVVVVVVVDVVVVEVDVVVPLVITLCGSARAGVHVGDPPEALAGILAVAVTVTADRATTRATQSRVNRTSRGRRERRTHRLTSFRERG